MNGKQHMLIGVGSGAAMGVAEVIQNRNNYDFGTASPVVAVAAVGGVLGSMFPDFLEPATSPNHRQGFHSLLVLILVGSGLYWVWKQPAKDTLGCALLKGLLAGYGSHLLTDAATPRGLPVI